MPRASLTYRNSTGCLDDSHNHQTMDASDITLSDLAPTKPSRSSGPKKSSCMDESSARTATTIGNSSGTDFSRRSIMDASDGSSRTSVRTRELRNLKGIRRRRSDPVTRRWREQCSKLYKEHVLDSCPELPPPLTLMTEQSEETAAARRIQSNVRSFLERRQG